MKKASASDFKENLLPKTRKEQFFDILKLRLGTIVVLGLILLLFFLPIFICLAVKLIYPTLVAESLSKEELLKFVDSVDLVCSLILIPCILIFSIGLAGVLKVLRRLIWAEPVFLKEDFVLGVKENIKGFLSIGFIVGVLNAICTITRLLLPANNAFFYIPTISCLVALYPICFVFLFINVVYSNTVFRNLITSIKILVRSYLINILFCLICYGLFLISSIPNAVQFIVAILVIIFILPILLLMFFEYEIHIFDKFINPYQSEKFVNKGLYKEKKDETKNKQV